MEGNISSDLLMEIYSRVEKKFGTIPFKLRGIKITHKLIKVSVEILNNEVNKMLPQNSRNLCVNQMPDGLDKKIKEALNSNLRTANIISDVLKDAEIVEVIKIVNPKTGRNIKATRLLEKWSW